jgi:NDP-sugar pyrophosphorylase family protein
MAKPKVAETSKQKKIRKGMVLAAGLGTRLLPITEKTPKPLVPVLNVPNILYSIFLLKRAGIEDITINVHHLGDSLVEFLGDGDAWGVRLHFSKETLLLGTGGGLKKAQPFFNDEPLVLVNCDFISNVDLRPLIAKHQEQGALASMVLWDNPKMQAFYGKVGIDGQGHLCSLPLITTSEPVRTGIFTGIHILEPEIFDYLEAVPSGINQVLYPALMQGKPESTLGLFMEKSYWYDTGALPHLYETSMHLMESLQAGDGPMREFLKTMGHYEEKSPGIWAPIDTSLPKDLITEGPVIVGKDCIFGARATIGPYAIVGDHSQVDEEAKVKGFVGLKHSRIPAHQVSENVLQFEELSIRMDKQS